MIEIKLDGMDSQHQMPEKSDVLSEFTIPKSEVDTDLATGEFGTISIPVEVVSVESDEIVFRKHGPIKTDGSFKAESLEQMRERIGVVDDEQEPMQKKKQEPQEEIGE